MDAGCHPCCGYINVLQISDSAFIIYGGDRYLLDRLSKKRFRSELGYCRHRDGLVLLRHCPPVWPDRFNRLGAQA